MVPGILIPARQVLTTSTHDRKLLAKLKISGVDEEPPLVDAPAADKSKIVVANQYLFQHDLEAARMMDERDTAGRLQGIGVIEGARRVLRMPLKTYGTACVFFMRYRYHVALKGDEETNRYDFRDAAIASLWLASKAEETPKKSKEILCAARNAMLPPDEQMSPEDEVFESQTKLMINLERYLLEIVGFDFRARNSGELLAALCHTAGVSSRLAKIALKVCSDGYRTFAVLKQTRQTMAAACLELAGRFLEKEVDEKVNEEGLKWFYEEYGTTRQEVLETLLDLLDLYMNHQALTATGSMFALNDFMRVSMALRQELRTKNYSRYAYFQENHNTTSPTTSPLINDLKSNTPSTYQNTPRTPQVPSKDRDRDRDTGSAKKEKEHEQMLIDIGKPVSPPPEHLLRSTSSSITNNTMNPISSSPTSPTSPTQEPPAPNPDDPSQVKEIVRFVLDVSRARDEEIQRRPYYDIQTVQVTEERAIWVPRDAPDNMEPDSPPTSPAAPAPARDVVMRDAGPATGGGRREERDRDRERGGRRRSPSPRGGYNGRRDDRDRDRDRDRERERGYRRDERRW